MERDGKATVHDQPCKMNRIIRMEIMNSYGDEDYAMGGREIRENLLIWNTRTEKKADSQEASDAPCSKEAVTV